jgi:hypothetical protein
MQIHAIIVDATYSTNTKLVFLIDKKNWMFKVSNIRFFEEYHHPHIFCHM